MLPNKNVIIHTIKLVTLAIILVPEHSKASGHVFVCQGYRFTSFYIFLLKLFQQCGLFLFSV